MFISLFIITSAFASPYWKEVLAQRQSIIQKNFQPKGGEKISRPFKVVENFVGNDPIETSLTGVEIRGVNSGSTLTTPWSGHFWPNYQGGLGARLADHQFPRDNWGAGFQFVQQNDWTRSSYELLSPSEKYDLVTGQWPGEFGSLTQHQWNLGKSEFENIGNVATWQGICHGWSPASFNLPSPVRPVTISTPEGDITFTVDDIKALGALYWANGEYESVYNGVRCNSPSRVVDGREMTPECFDVNPADWYLALVNLVGIKRGTFLVDASAGEQVWNKPVISYQHEYFDIANNKTSRTFRPVLKEKSRLRGLRFRQFRDPQTFYVVGVKTTVVFGDGQPFGIHTPDRKTFVYYYDLELDQNMRVLGGEWRSEIHPDFLWRPAFNADPVSKGDHLIELFERAGTMKLRRAARESSFLGQPLRSFVLFLFESSRI